MFPIVIHLIALYISLASSNFGKISLYHRLQCILQDRIRARQESRLSIFSGRKCSTELLTSRWILRENGANPILHDVIVDLAVLFIIYWHLI